MDRGEVVIPILKMRKTEAQSHTVISPSVTEQKSTSAWTRGQACGAQIGVPSPRPRPVACLSTTAVYPAVYHSCPPLDASQARLLQAPDTPILPSPPETHPACCWLAV